MPEISASATADLRCAPEAAYGILIDYRELHPQILPRPSFGALVVERGGVGAGTVFRVELREGVRTRWMRMEASEPQPGRVLVETDLESDLVTTFTVEPMDGGSHTRATITTRWTRGGVRGFVERLLLPPLMRRVFLQELRNLEQLARERAGASAAS